MPFDLFLNNTTDKGAVIFDFGTAYTKLGFSGETGPRAIVPTSVTENGKVNYIFEIEDPELQKEFFIKFLYEIYYRKLIVNPKDRRIVVVESVINPSQRREIIAKVLFEQYEVPSILFAPVHLITLLSLGLQTGLVIDCGYEECTMIPVVEGFHLLRNWQALPIGGCNVEKKIMELIKQSGILIDSNNKFVPFSDIENHEEILTRSVLEDIKVRMCVVTPIERALQWYRWDCTKDTSEEVSKPSLVQEMVEYFTFSKASNYPGDICIKIPIEVRELGMELIFDEREEQNLVTMVLDAIHNSPVDCRKQLAANLVVVGGCGSVPGFRSRMLAGIKRLVESENSRYNRLMGLEFKVHNLPGHPNYGGWLGGAIFGHLDALGVRSISRETYLEKKGRVHDWSDSTVAPDISRQGA